jgi:hypothetical protein
MSTVQFRDKQAEEANLGRRESGIAKDFDPFSPSFVIFF